LHNLGAAKVKGSYSIHTGKYFLQDELSTTFCYEIMDLHGTQRQTATSGNTAAYRNGIIINQTLTSHRRYTPMTRMTNTTVVICTEHIYEEKTTNYSSQTNGIRLLLQVRRRWRRNSALPWWLKTNRRKLPRWGPIPHGLATVFHLSAASISQVSSEWVRFNVPVNIL